MQVRSDQLSQHLSKGMAPCYVVSGNEPLLLDEAVAALREAAEHHGFSERLRFDADGDFEWQQLGELQDSLSLFAERRLIEIRLGDKKPGDKGGKALIEYCTRPNPDDVLLLTSGQLDARTRKTKWYSSLDKLGVSVQIWPVDRNELAPWIGRRAKALGMTLSREAIEELALRSEGNLLACNQELIKLHMIHGGERLGAEDVISSAADCARYETFDLVDAVLIGDGARAIRILESLRREGQVPNLLLGTLGWLLRSLYDFAQATSRGESLDATLRRQPAWSRRRAMVARGLNRLDLQQLERIIARLRTTDAITKGARHGDPWNELRGICLAICATGAFPEQND